MVQKISAGTPLRNTQFATSEQYLINKRQQQPTISPAMAKSVSHVRRETLQDEMLSGQFHNPNIPTRQQTSDPFAPSPAGFVTYAKSNSGLNKFAEGTDPGVRGGTGYRGQGGTMRQSPDIYSPLWLNSNLNLPRDRATINAWSRAFFALNGIVQNAILLHSTYPISKLNIKCKHPQVERFFADMNEEIDLMTICEQVAQEYWLLGEAFPYAELDESSRKWSRILIQNPDYVVVQRSVVADEPIISLRPDDNLLRICKSNKPSDLIQRQKLDKSIIEHVRRGENIPLNNFYVSHLARKINPYDVRGTGLIVSSFRRLMLYDRLIEAKYAQSSNLINPITLIKIGGDDYKPSPSDLQAWREVFEECQNDPDFKIFTHDKVAVERVGANSAVIDINPDLVQIIKEIFIGLLVPSVLMDGGSDTTYANGGVALDVLRQRYLQFQNKLTIWLRRRIFAPISKINDFYEYVDKKKVLIVPDVEWNHMNLFDTNDFIQVMKELAGGDKPIVSRQSLYRSLGLQYDDELQKMRKEHIDEIILEKEKKALDTMTLNDLRALGPSDAIQEGPESPLPGEQPEQATGGEESGGESMSLPGMPSSPTPLPEPSPPPAPPSPAK